MRVHGALHAFRHLCMHAAIKHCKRTVITASVVSWGDNMKRWLAEVLEGRDDDFLYRLRAALHERGWKVCSSSQQQPALAVSSCLPEPTCPGNSHQGGCTEDGWHRWPEGGGCFARRSCQGLPRSKGRAQAGEKMARMHSSLRALRGASLLGLRVAGTSSRAHASKGGFGASIGSNRHTAWTSKNSTSCTLSFGKGKHHVFCCTPASPGHFASAQEAELSQALPTWKAQEGAVMSHLHALV